MATKRYHGNVVILPTGDLFAIGGRWSLAHGTLSPFNFTPELLTSSGWMPMANHDGPRDYHSTAILLPDARVLVGGGEHRTKDYQIWEPPYLHQDWGGDRPADVDVLTEPGGVHVSDQTIAAMCYNAMFRATWSNPMPAGVQVERVVLMRPSALTHHDDGGQMLVRLTAWDDGVADSVVFRSPTSILHAPPGWYMLFLVTSNGVPSMAYWVNLG